MASNSPSISSTTSSAHNPRSRTLYFLAPPSFLSFSSTRSPEPNPYLPSSLGYSIAPPNAKVVRCPGWHLGFGLEGIEGVEPGLAHPIKSDWEHKEWELEWKRKEKERALQVKSGRRSRGHTPTGNRNVEKTRYPSPHIGDHDQATKKESRFQEWESDFKGRLEQFEHNLGWELHGHEASERERERERRRKMWEFCTPGAKTHKGRGDEWDEFGGEDGLGAKVGDLEGLAWAVTRQQLDEIVKSHAHSFLSVLSPPILCHPFKDGDPQKTDGEPFWAMTLLPDEKILSPKGNRPSLFYFKRLVEATRATALSRDFEAHLFLIRSYSSGGVKKIPLTATVIPTVPVQLTASSLTLFIPFLFAYLPLFLLRRFLLWTAVLFSPPNLSSSSDLSIFRRIPIAFFVFLAGLVDRVKTDVALGGWQASEWLQDAKKGLNEVEDFIQDKIEEQSTSTSISKVQSSGIVQNGHRSSGGAAGNTAQSKKQQ